MVTRFWKMHGAGNDFVVIDERLGALGFGPARIVALADRRTGVGCDQLVLLRPAPPGADIWMGIWNPDGTEAGACGNATRCVAALLHAEGIAAPVVATRAGLLPTAMQANGAVRVDMGPARLGWRDVPLAYACDTLHLPLPGDPAAASMGNPHATVFVDSVEDHPVALAGAALETDPIFPQRANIGFAQILAPDRIRLRVWERGAGLTRACGSGACAALVNAHRRGLAGREATLLLDGGTLHVTWRDDGHVLMTGPAVLAYTGEIALNALPA